MDSVRVLILNAVLGVLETVEGIGDTGGVKRMLLDVQTFPAGFVTPGNDEVIEYIGHFITREMEVDTQLGVNAEGNVLAVLEEFLPKVQQKYAADYTIGFGQGGPVLDFTELRVSEPFPFTTAENIAGIVITHKVQYRVRRDDPYSWT